LREILHLQQSGTMTGQHDWQELKPHSTSLNV